MKIELDMKTLIEVSATMTTAAHKAIVRAKEYPQHSDIFQREADRVFEAMNRFRVATGQDVLTVEELERIFR